MKAPSALQSALPCINDLLWAAAPVEQQIKRHKSVQNFSTGQHRFLEGAEKNPKFCLLRGDNLDLVALTAGMARKKGS